MYRSNRAEFLARLLAAQLRLAPPPPLETAVVVVNTWPTSRWLGERLAETLGATVIVEALQSGTPVIASDCAGNVGLLGPERALEVTGHAAVETIG